MNATTILAWSLTLGQSMLALAAACAAFRIVVGPRAQDRVLGLDTLYTVVLLLLVTLGIRYGTTVHFEAALIIAIIGFVATASFAKFLMRGEVIE